MSDKGRKGSDIRKEMADVAKLCGNILYCDTQYDCSQGEICGGTAPPPGIDTPLQYDCLKPPSEGTDRISSGICMPAKNAIADSDGSCKYLTPPGDEFEDTFKNVSGFCVPKGKKQPVTIQLMWIVFIGLAYIAFGKILQAMFHQKSFIIPLVFYVPLFIGYAIMMFVNYKKWSFINPNLNFLSGGLPPYAVFG